MRLLELLAFEPRSAPQLAAALHAQPRTVRRVLARLVDDGYVTYSPGGRRIYEPTMRLVALAGQVVNNSALARRSRPYVALLHERADAAAHLVVPSYTSVLCLVHCASSTDDGRPRLRELVPAHCTAGGKLLLAWREGWRESLLARPLPRMTERTVVDPAALRRELEEIRAGTHAREDGEFQTQLQAVAAPVLVGNEAVAALTVSSQRLDLDAAAAAVIDVARDLSDDLAVVG